MRLGVARSSDILRLNVGYTSVILPEGRVHEFTVIRIKKMHESA
jgi:hypothetical protein